MGAVTGVISAMAASTVVVPRGTVSTVLYQHPAGTRASRCDAALLLHKHMEILGICGEANGSQALNGVSLSVNPPLWTQKSVSKGALSTQWLRPSRPHLDEKCVMDNQPKIHGYMMRKLLLASSEHTAIESVGPAGAPCHQPRAQPWGTGGNRAKSLQVKQRGKMRLQKHQEVQTNHEIIW